jgi:hypothetical protein
MRDKTKKKKAKSTSRVQDLKPTKDAKGGTLNFSGSSQLPAVQRQIDCRKAGGDPG